MTQPREDAPKPVEDGFPFILEQDSLANSMGLKIPNRSLMPVSYTHLTLPTIYSV